MYRVWEEILSGDFKGQFRCYTGWHKRKFLQGYIAGKWGFNPPNVFLSRGETQGEVKRFKRYK